MAQGDRVVIGDGYRWSKADNTKTVVYALQMKESGGPVQMPDGSMIPEVAGGVKVGSLGVVHGGVVNVHRSYIKGQDAPPSLAGHDFVQLVPVFLEEYQRVGYFPVDHVRIFSGAAL